MSEIWQDDNFHRFDVKTPLGHYYQYVNTLIISNRGYGTTVAHLPFKRRVHVWMDGWMNQAYSRLSTTHGHITDCKLLVCMYWTRLVLLRPAASLYSASPLKHHPTGKQ